jgi:cellulose synthase/poly-beta-1,6-N-acetylglucosamine synthase-like glycosyltransferase
VRPARVAILVPCRNEAGVLARKLENLRSLRLPEGGPHRVLVVDDHSEGESLAAIVEGFSPPEGLEFRYVRSSFAPGKAGALEAGLLAARGFDVVVVTDADVTFERDALLRLVDPFDDPEVLVVSGAQRIVPRLSGAEGLDGEAERFYDRFTRAVRRREARGGFVFSVHGECLALRGAAGLRAECGVASDDLDLALEARRRGGKVLYAPEARFFETRPATREGRRRQDLRRARSFVQFVFRRAEVLLDPRLARRDRARLLVYFAIPFFPFVALGGSVAIVGFAWRLPVEGRIATLALPLLLLASSGARDVLRRLVVLGRATLEYPLGVRATDRWEPVR